MARRPKPPPPPRGLTKPLKRLEYTPDLARMRAQFIYVQQRGVSLRKVWNDYRMDEDDPDSPLIRECVSWQHLERGALAGKWKDLRDRHWKSVEAQVFARLQTSAVERELEEIEELDALMAEAINLTRVTEPNSFEGMVGGVVRLSKLLTEKRNNVIAAAAAAGVEPVKGTPPARVVGPSRVPDDLSDTDVAAMAVALARRRAGVTDEEE